MNQESFQSMEAIKETIETRKKMQLKRRRQRRFKRFLRIVLVIAVLAGIVALDQSPMSRIQAIRVVGNETIPQAEIVQKMGVKVGDRMIFNWASRLEKKLSKLEGLDRASATIYYRQGILNVKVTEKKKVGYLNGDPLKLIYADGTRRDIAVDTLKAIGGLPLFAGFQDEQLTLDILEKFAALNQDVLLTISEVHLAPESYDLMHLKLIMNNKYFVYSSISALPLLRSYASIIDRADPAYRCIYLLEYGPTPESQIATVKRCDE